MGSGGRRSRRSVALAAGIILAPAIVWLVWALGQPADPRVATNTAVVLGTVAGIDPGQLICLEAPGQAELADRIVVAAERARGVRARLSLGQGNTQVVVSGRSAASGLVFGLGRRRSLVGVPMCLRNTGKARISFRGQQRPGGVTVDGKREDFTVLVIGEDSTRGTWWQERAEVVARANGAVGAPFGGAMVLLVLGTFGFAVLGAALVVSLALRSADA